MLYYWAKPAQSNLVLHTQLKLHVGRVGVAEEGRGGTRLTGGWVVDGRVCTVHKQRGYCKVRYPRKGCYRVSFCPQSTGAWPAGDTKTNDPAVQVKVVGSDRDRLQG